MMNFKQIPIYFNKYLKRFKKIFTKPQFHNFKRLVSGLILSEKKTIQEINAVYDEKNQSSLNRFVTESKWEHEKVNDIRLDTCVGIFGSKESGAIIIDDVMTKKTGRKMEKANYHRSGVTKKKEWGHCFVDCLYADFDSENNYPIRIDSYLREENADGENPFKTKRDIALNQIDYAMEHGVKAKNVFVDAWYYGKDFINALKTRILNYFVGIKSNVKITFNNKKRIGLGEYRDALTRENFDKFELENGIYFLHKQEINIRGIGKQMLLISYKQGDEENIKCYVTNIMNWENAKYINALLKRWNIECLHRDMKQHLGLEKYQVRKYRGMQAVALAILVAYTLLILNKLPSLLQKFRPLKTIGEMCRFAQLVAQKSNYWLRKTFGDYKLGAKILNQWVVVKNAKV